MSNSLLSGSNSGVKPGVLAVIGAHHDDVELRAAGSIGAYLAAGWRVESVVATTTPSIGPRSRVRTEEPILDTGEVINRRESESLAAAAVLGLPTVHFWRFRSMYWYRAGGYEREYPDGVRVRGEVMQEVLDEIDGRETIMTAHRVPEVVNWVADTLEDWGVDMVMTHICDDGHWEHHATAMLVSLAVRELWRRGRRVRLLGWEPGSMHGLHNYFLPTLYVDITPWMELKCAAVRPYHSQFGDTELVAATVRQRAADYGRLFGVEYAEPFVELDGTRDAFDTTVWLPDWYDPSIARPVGP